MKTKLCFLRNHWVISNQILYICKVQVSVYRTIGPHVKVKVLIMSTLVLGDSN